MLSHIPERRGIIQTGKDLLHCGPFIAICLPALFDDRPQLAVETEEPCPLRFRWSFPIDDGIGNHIANFNFVEWVDPTQNLEHPGLTVKKNGMAIRVRTS